MIFIKEKNRSICGSQCFYCIDLRFSRELEIDEVIVNHGQKSDFTGYKDWGLDMHDWNIFVSPILETNLPGIFGAGDFANYESKVNLIAGAFTDAALALNSAKRYMDPEAPRTSYVRSSHNERFKEQINNGKWRSPSYEMVSLFNKTFLLLLNNAIRDFQVYFAWFFAINK